jgi:UDP-N-acetylglucosamine pyrophosphorylase
MFSTTPMDTNTIPNLAIIIMAAGKGTRMKDPSRAKVMYEVLGKPMIHYVVDVACMMRPTRILVVVGYERQKVMEYLGHTHPSAICVVQEEQLGTGHAVMQAAGSLSDFVGDVIVLSGDVPLLTVSTLNSLLQHHRNTRADATILTAELGDPTGYGRIIRNVDGEVEKIVEEKDATEEEKKIREINSGIYVFNTQKLFESLGHLSPVNAQNEYYLTDVFEFFWKKKWRVAAVKAADADEIRGVNTVAQLEEVRRLLEQKGTQEHLYHRQLS